VCWDGIDGNVSLDLSYEYQALPYVNALALLVRYNFRVRIKPLVGVPVSETTWMPDVNVGNNSCFEMCDIDPDRSAYKSLFIRNTNTLLA
jgi:hypothetical protein